MSSPIFSLLCQLIIFLLLGVDADTTGGASSQSFLDLPPSAVPVVPAPASSKPFLPSSALHKDPFAPYLHRKHDRNDDRRSLNVDLFKLPDTGQLNLTLVRHLIRDMFFHSWDGYLDFAYPHDELAPISCTSQENQDGLFYTLIDSADTLAVMGEWTEFARAILLIESIPNFDLDTSVSVFETTIRVLGGLMSTHIIATRKFPAYSGRLLHLAKDLGDRLILAFNVSGIGIPYGGINLKHGIRENEPENVCTACALSLSLEFGYLSHLTGNATYMKLAKKAVKEIWVRRSSIDLLGRRLQSQTGDWVDSTSSIAGEMDSLFEYFLKTYLVFHDPFWYQLFVDAYTSAETHILQSHGWHLLVDMNAGNLLGFSVSSLQAFWSGMQVLAGDLFKAAGVLERFNEVATAVPFLPESITVASDCNTDNMTCLQFTGEMDWRQRPEMVESMMYMYRVTKDPGLLEAGFEFIRRIMDHTRTPCGFAGVENVKTLELRNTQDSFFLAETLKYLYLMFDPTNTFHDPEWVFTTEAHPLPILPIHTSRHFKKARKAMNKIANHTAIQDPINRRLTRKRTWLDEQCDVTEWRVLQALYGLAPSNTTRSWFQYWGHALLG